jgi:hypothetical protein
MAVFMSDGTLIQRETTPGGGTYTTIPQATNITPPKWVRKTADVYIHDQNAPVVKTGAYEAMEVSFQLAWDPGNSAYHQVLFSDADAKTERSYQIVFPDTGTAQFRFNAIVSAIEPGEASAEGTEPLTLTVTLKLSAAPTITW